ARSGLTAACRRAGPDSSERQHGARRCPSGRAPDPGWPGHPRPGGRHAPRAAAKSAPLTTRPPFLHRRGPTSSLSFGPLISILEKEHGTMRTRRLRSGFTLIELLVVIAIIAI